MDIIRNDDGTLVVPVEPSRADTDDAERADTAAGGDDSDDGEGEAAAPTTRTLHPGEGGYDEALAQWDEQQHPDRGPAVSTPTGREQAMAVVHTVADDPDHDVAAAVEGVATEPVAEALRHVLVGGQPSVDAFAHEVADAEGGEAVPAHEVTKVIGEVLGEIDG